MTCKTCKSDRCGNHAACERKEVKKASNRKTNEVLLKGALQEIVVMKQIKLGRQLTEDEVLRTAEDMATYIEAELAKGKTKGGTP